MAIDRLHLPRVAADARQNLLHGRGRAGAIDDRTPTHLGRTAAGDDLAPSKRVRRGSDECEDGGGGKTHGTSWGVPDPSDVPNRTSLTSVGCSASWAPAASKWGF